MTRTLSLAALAALTLTVGPLSAEDNSPATKLNGGYTIVSGERDGKGLPEAEVQGIVVRFSDGTVTVTDKDNKETYAATYRLDPSKKPCAITMTSTQAPTKGEVAQGLIEKNEDTVRIIYALPGAKPPTGFKTKQKQLMFVMKNLNKGPEKRR
jgi:uncharacterized protein (TIGR03067 family)